MIAPFIGIKVIDLFIAGVLHLWLFSASLRPALVLFAGCLLVLGLLYPLVVTGIAGTAFRPRPTAG